MDYPKVSIGIPTFNRADGFLKDAITSACRQTYENIEVIIADNCSSDHTSEVVKGFLNARTHYYRHDENIGPEKNFNFLLQQAKGDYFLLLHDDDQIDDDFIQSCLSAANYKTHFGLIRTGVRIIDEAGQIVREKKNEGAGESYSDKLLAWFNHLSPWYLCNTLFNREGLMSIGGFQSKRQLLQDGVAVTKLYAQSPSIDVQDVKASFRKHGGEITFAVRVADWVEDFQALLDLMVEQAHEDKARIHSEGQRFFSELGYKRAEAVKSRLGRWMSYWCVYKAFDYNYLPPELIAWKGRLRRALKIGQT